MVVLTIKELDGLSKDELWLVALDSENDRLIQDAALQCWMDIDDQDYENSVQRMRSLVDLVRASMRGYESEWSDYIASHKSA